MRAHSQVDETLRKEIGARIRKRRHALGLSQREIGERMTNAKGNDVAGTQVAAWETGRLFPERRYWRQLADALDTDLVSVFGALAREDDDLLANRVDEVEEKLAALADMLGVTDGLEQAMRTRRRVRRATSRAADAGDEVPAADLIPARDRDDDEDTAVSR